LFGFSPEGGTSLPVCVSHRTAVPPNTLKSPEGGTRTAGVRKPPDLGAHPTPLNAQRATYEVSGKRLFPHAYRLKPLACFGLFGFSPEGGTSLPVCVSHRTAGPPQHP
jgi:hypothetical protein